PVRGDLPFTGTLRKLLDEDFTATGFIRNVRDPFSVWRYLRKAFLRIRLKNSNRLFVSRYRNNPYVLMRLWIHLLKNELFAVRSPAHRHFDKLGFKNELFFRRAVRRPDVQSPLSFARGAECDFRPVGIPNGRPVVL